MFVTLDRIVAIHVKSISQVKLISQNNMYAIGLL